MKIIEDMEVDSDSRKRGNKKHIKYIERHYKKHYSSDEKLKQPIHIDLYFSSPIECGDFMVIVSNIIQITITNAVASITAAAAASTATVGVPLAFTGQVLDANNAPVPNVPLQVFDQTINAAVGGGMSDGSGNFNISATFTATSALVNGALVPDNVAVQTTA